MWYVRLGSSGAQYPIRLCHPWGLPRFVDTPAEAWLSSEKGAESTVFRLTTSPRVEYAPRRQESGSGRRVERLHSR